MTSVDLREGLMFRSETSQNIGIIVKRTEYHAIVSWTKSQKKIPIVHILNMSNDSYEIRVLIKKFKSGIWRVLTPVEKILWS